MNAIQPCLAPIGGDPSIRVIRIHEFRLDDLELDRRVIDMLVAHKQLAILQGARYGWLVDQIDEQIETLRHDVETTLRGEDA